MVREGPSSCRVQWLTCVEQLRLVERGTFVETLFSSDLNSPFLSVRRALTKITLETHTEELLERCQGSQALAASLKPPEGTAPIFSRNTMPRRTSAHSLQAPPLHPYSDGPGFSECVLWDAGLLTKSPFRVSHRRRPIPLLLFSPCFRRHLLRLVRSHAGKQIFCVCVWLLGNSDWMKIICFFKIHPQCPNQEGEKVIYLGQDCDSDLEFTFFFFF